MPVAAEPDVDERTAQRRRRQVRPVTDDELAELRHVGAAGEICTRFFGRDGAPCVTSLDRRMVAPDLGQLRAVPLVVGVACGQQKAAAILGAVRGGYLKALVTDDITATAVLALARSGRDNDDTIQGARAARHEGR
jgi:DNA-binding transcriptional regulator LsrR (DeoR family)